MKTFNHGAHRVYRDFLEVFSVSSVVSVVKSFCKPTKLATSGFSRNPATPVPMSFRERLHELRWAASALTRIVYLANRRAVSVIGVLASATETGQAPLTAAAIS